MDKTRMRISFAMINCNRRDGSARAVNEISERLAERGHEVSLYARRAEDIDLQKIGWHRIDGINWPEVADFYSYYIQVNRVFKGLDHLQGGKSGFQYDIVHSIGCNTAHANVVTIQNIQPAKKIILDRLSKKENISIPRRLTRWMYLKLTCIAEQRLYSFREGRPPMVFLPVSRGVENELRNHYDLGNSQVKIIPNAADTSRFRPLNESERSEWRAKNGYVDEDIVLLFAGGEWARKGLDYAIKALGLTANKNMKLYVAGDDADRDRFIRIARDADCLNRIHFGGFRLDVEKIMGAADMFLFPSWYEAFSLATIEAAACGLPVVATKINGTEDFIIPGVNGEFVEHDPLQTAKVLDALCAEKSRLKQMGLHARQIVEERYTWDRVTSMTEEAYRAVLQ